MTIAVSEKRAWRSGIQAKYVFRGDRGVIRQNLGGTCRSEGVISLGKGRGGGTTSIGNPSPGNGKSGKKENRKDGPHLTLIVGGRRSKKRVRKKKQIQKRGRSLPPRSAKWLKRNKPHVQNQRDLWIPLTGPLEKKTATRRFIKNRGGRWASSKCSGVKKNDVKKSENWARRVFLKGS